MTSFQSQLGEGGRSETTAQELAEGQRSISIAEFFEKNKQMLGFDSDAKALVTAVKEACDNSLTWSTPFVYRSSGETKHRPIGEAVDDLIESNREDVQVKRGGDLEKLRVENLEALSFDDEYDLDFRRIRSVFRHRVNSDIYRITVEGRREVELTDYHSVFVLRDGGTAEPVPEFAVLVLRDIEVEFPDDVEREAVALSEIAHPILLVDRLEDFLVVPFEEVFDLIQTDRLRRFRRKFQ